MGAPAGLFRASPAAAVTPTTSPSVRAARPREAPLQGPPSPEERSSRSSAIPRAPARARSPGARRRRARPRTRAWAPAPAPRSSGTRSRARRTSRARRASLVTNGGGSSSGSGVTICGAGGSGSTVGTTIAGSDEKAWAAVAPRSSSFPVSASTSAKVDGGGAGPDPGLHALHEPQEQESGGDLGRLELFEPRGGGGFLQRAPAVQVLGQAAGLALDLAQARHHLRGGTEDRVQPVDVAQHEVAIGHAADGRHHEALRGQLEVDRALGQHAVLEVELPVV